jgi:hypothetical protein
MRPLKRKHYFKVSSKSRVSFFGNQDKETILFNEDSFSELEDITRIYSILFKRRKLYSIVLKMDCQSQSYPTN